VVILSGGTGITGSDGTPEAIEPLLDKKIDGFGEIFRLKSYEKIKTSSLQSRAIAGVANRTFIFVLPGSLDACKTAWNDVISHQLNSDTKPCNLVMLMPRLKE
jgi:molybdenum cofactor biosynthesis protein B